MARNRDPKPQYPDPEVIRAIAGMELGPRQVVEGLRVGRHKSPLRGFSTEFSQYRPYAAGDEVRRVDWRVYARNDRYYVKLFEAETDFAAHLLLDASSSMRYGSGAVNKLEYAKQMAAALAHLIVARRDAVGLAVFDDGLRSYIEPKSAPGIVKVIARELENARDAPHTDVARILHEFARKLRRRGVVILFSDLLDDPDGFINGLNHLRFRGHSVIVFHVLDPYEIRFPLRGVWKFRDIEGAETLVTQPARVREAYLRNLRVFLDGTRRACEDLRIDYTLVDTGRPVGVTLSAFLAGHAGGRP